MSAESNDRIQRVTFGGPPMVRINGAKARQLREAQGLTQLYIATAVGVTTDTISRWENRKTPSVKKENALKLAEALGVELELLLFDEEAEEIDETKNVEETPDASQKGMEPPSQHREGGGGTTNRQKERQVNRWAWFISAFAILIVIAGAVYWYNSINSERTDIAVSARRIMPSHAPAGSTFPVIISVSSTCPEKLSLIVTEHLPAAAEILKSVPPWSASSPGKKKIKWIATASSKKTFSICYLIRISPRTETGSFLDFRGEVTSSLTGREVFQIYGTESLEVEPYHWADLNSDGQIDDEEILRVFDELGERKGLEFGLDEIKKIWSSGGYRWDSKRRRYIPVRQESQNEK